MRFWLKLRDWIRPALGQQAEEDARLEAALAKAFDARAYLAAFSDVAEADADPLRHAVAHGAAENRLSRMGLMDRTKYARGADASLSDRDLILEEGELFVPGDGRSSASSNEGTLVFGHDPAIATFKDPEDERLAAAIAGKFNPDEYLKAFPELAAAQVNPLEHVVKHGAASNRLTKMGLMDRSRYARSSDKTATDRELILEEGRLWVVEGRKDDDATKRVRELFTLLGIPEGEEIEEGISRLAIAMFDPESYRIRHGLSDDLTTAQLLTRYIMFDFPRGVPPGLFDTEFYEASIAREGLSIDPAMTPFQHWLEFGVERRISPTPLFDEADYLVLNADLKAFSGWLFEHWLFYGMPEGRRFDRNVSVAAQRAFARRPGRGLTDFARMASRTPGYADALLDMRAFRNSKMFARLVAEAGKIDPNIQTVRPNSESLVPPLHDDKYGFYLKVLDRIPEGTFDAVVLIPYCKVGGADFVAGLVAKNLAGLGARTLVLRTDDNAFDRPDWFPENVETVDISGALKVMPELVRTRALYEIIRATGAKVTINVNSRLAFQTIETFGRRLQLITDLYCYYFCADHTPDGQETGYPVWYFAPLLPDLDGALVDTQYLSDTLVKRHALPPSQAGKLKVLHTPATNPERTETAAAAADASAQSRKRPRILWAGRFDRQKRFDLLIEVARQMPDVDFDIWGKAVLDKPPQIDNLPDNLTIHAPFKKFAELPVTDADGWLYTSSWDGMPTILIEIANMGLAVAASAVGGVPELIDETTGWPIPAKAGVSDTVKVVRDMLGDREGRLRRAEALMARVRQQHSRKAYEDVVASMLTAAGVPVRHG